MTFSILSQNFRLFSPFKGLQSPLQGIFKTECIVEPPMFTADTPVGPRSRYESGPKSLLSFSTRYLISKLLPVPV